MTRLPDVSIPRLLLVGLTLTVVAAVVGYGSVSSAAFGAYNSGWDGTSALRSTAAGTGAQVTVAQETDAYDRAAPRRTVAFVVAPTSTYDSRAILRLREFVRRGGVLVVAADDNESVNYLLQGLGARARLDGRPLRDARVNFRTPAMPVVSTGPNQSLVSGVDGVTLNYGTAVRPRGATVVLNTSEYAYLDTNRNGTIDEGERLAARPVATVERIGAGRVVAVSDASVFINAMLDRPGNRQFVRELVDGRSRVLVDSSHAARLPPVRAALWAVRDSPLVQFGLGAAVVGLLGVVSRRSGALDALRRRWDGDPGVERSAVDREQLVAYLERQHPEWERERIERVVSAMRDDE
ncbi:DUF4350 domain-containing protein [Halorussus sp. AFM4]|uniref:DUF4350 domain-containing protein n=1 Tax=Halorussus sp. AFM4 TaxID=3421651 RepID=UPI003EBB5A5B